LDNTRRRLYEEESHEELNENGIIKDSSLTIKVVGAYGLDNQANRECNARVNIFIGN
jgi:hypothetical protein